MVDGSTADRVAGRGVRGWFGDRRVSTKILSAVLTGCVVAVAIGLLAVTGLAQVASTARDLYQHRVLPQSALADLRQSVMTARLDALAWHTARSEATAGQSQALLARTRRRSRPQCRN